MTFKVVSDPNVASQYGDHFCEIVVRIWDGQIDGRTTRQLYAPPNFFEYKNVSVILFLWFILYLNYAVL